MVEGGQGEVQDGKMSDAALRSAHLIHLSLQRTLQHRQAGQGGLGGWQGAKGRASCGAFTHLTPTHVHASLLAVSSSSDFCIVSLQLFRSAHTFSAPAPTCPHSFTQPPPHTPACQPVGYELVVSLLERFPPPAQVHLQLLLPTHVHTHSHICPLTHLHASLLAVSSSSAFCSASLRPLRSACSFSMAFLRCCAFSPMSSFNTFSHSCTPRGGKGKRSRLAQHLALGREYKQYIGDGLVQRLLTLLFAPT